MSSLWLIFLINNKINLSLKVVFQVKIHDYLEVGGISSTWSAVEGTCSLMDFPSFSFIIEHPVQAQD
jgi:hypothetical protein